MWYETSLTRLLGIQYPLILAPMAGGPTTPELVAAVSNAGGLGSLGAAYLAPAALRAAIHAIRERTDRPFNVNLFAPLPEETPPAAVARAQARLDAYRAELGIPASAAPTGPFAPAFAEALAALVEERVPVVSFTFGLLPADAMRQIKESGAVVLGTATTVAEGVALAASGVDGVVAQGSEAGGHRGTFLGDMDAALIGTLALVPQLADAVRVPVVAAGGIMDGRGLVAALALGAAGAQMGTAFLTCPESGAHPQHKAALLAATDDATRLTRAFSGRTARALRNRFVEEMRGHEDDIAPYPAQNVLTRDIRQAAARQDQPEFLSLWSGQAPRLARTLPAAELVRAVVEEAERVIARLSSR
ncbi:MAG TPA: nitronate monooxygenase [Ktedonobacterales bacterium]|nr:nitronate monooxygenase [Ktedonobacterales bacterium]